jgi:hypothetical protein
MAVEANAERRATSKSCVTRRFHAVGAVTAAMRAYYSSVSHYAISV